MKNLNINMTTKLFFSILILGILGTSCGPKPKDVEAPHNPLKPVHGVQTLEAFGEFDSSTMKLATMFLWPTEQDLEVISKNTGINSLDESADKVGEHSTNLDKIYYAIASAEKEKAQKEAEIASRWEPYKDEKFPEFRAPRYKAIMDSYACFVDPANRNQCARTPQAGDPTASISTPSTCNKLKEKPWKKTNDEVIECGKKVNGILDLFREEFKLAFKDLHDRKDQLFKLIQDYDKETTEEINQIIPAVDPFGDPTDYKNWIQIEFSNSKMAHEKGDAPPTSIFLEIKFNNLKDNDFSKHLPYSSVDEYLPGQGPDIVNVDLKVEKETPTLTFRILEKRVLLPEEEDNKNVSNTPSVRTGFYYDLVLRRSVQSFGLVYVGKMKKYNAKNEEVGNGMLKLIIPETFKADVPAGANN